MEPSLISVNDASVALGVSVRTIWRMIAAGELSKTKVRSRSLIPLMDVKAIAAGKKNESK
mgnify:CR=1 FL=1